MERHACWVAAKSCQVCVQQAELQCLVSLKLRPQPALSICMQAAASIKERLWHEGKQRLMRSFRAETSPVEAFCDDYAFVISGLLVRCISVPVLS